MRAQVVHSGCFPSARALPRSRRALRLGCSFLLALSFGLLSSVGATGAAALPSGFQESVALSGLTQPTAVRFAQDGRIFVAEKSGQIKVFDDLADTSPTLFANLSTNVHTSGTAGCLGLRSTRTSRPLPTSTSSTRTMQRSAALLRGGARPACSQIRVRTRPGRTATDASCRVGSLASRRANTMTGQEQVLIEDWCQQYPSLSVGGLAFGADGALYASAGTGSSFTFNDWGQDGDPVNPCGDPPGGVGAVLSPPTAEGGSLRGQDTRTGGDPVTLDGTVIRVDPNTGSGLPENPLAASGDANARRIVAYGLRNPFRLAIRPGTNQVWVGDVGTGNFEEINRVANPQTPRRELRVALL